MAQATWGERSEQIGLVGYVDAIENPRRVLDEPMPEGVAGTYWGGAESDIDSQVEQAMAALEVLLRKANRHSSPEYRSRLTMAIDRALADPANGYLKRLRITRSAALREWVASWRPTERREPKPGEALKAIAAKLSATVGRISVGRLRQLMHNNRTYVSPEREIALEVMREQVAAERSAKAAQRAAARKATAAAKAAQARLDRVAQGRELAARLAAGATRDELCAELGFSRQRFAQLLAEARNAQDKRAEPVQLAA